MQILHNYEFGKTLEYVDAKLEVKPDNSGNVQLTRTEAGLKAEVVLPESSGSVEIEEINASLAFTSDQGLVVHRNDTNANHPLTNLGRIKGTDWLVIRANDVFGDVKPAPSDINTYLEVDCGLVEDGGDHYKLISPLSVKVTTSDTGGRVPQTVKFDVKLGSQTRTYSYPYSASNTYEWNSIGDFTYEGNTGYRIENARVEFTDGSSSSSLHQLTNDCVMARRRDL